MHFFWYGPESTCFTNFVNRKMRSDLSMRCILLVFGLLVFIMPDHSLLAQGLYETPHFFAEQRSSMLWTGEDEGDSFGNRCKFAGDINNDGVIDIVVGARFNDGGGVDSGRVYVFSGADGSLLHYWTGEGPGDEFGHRITVPGDLNGDGYADLVITAFFNDANGENSGRVYAYSGWTGEILYQLDGEEIDSQFGRQTWAIQDTDNDQRNDIIVAARNGKEGTVSKVYLFSGATGEERFSVVGETPFDGFGFRIRDAGDVNNDGVHDILSSAPNYSTNLPNAGRVYVISGVDGDILWTVDGENANDHFGERISPAGDVNRDGYADFLVSSIAYSDHAGKVYLYSGRTGSLLQSFKGDSKGDQFGDRMTSLGDVDGDGYSDFIISAPYNDAGAFNAGKVYVYSGRTRTLIYSQLGTISDGLFGRSLASLSDINRDGFDDFVVAAPHSNANGEMAGRLYIYSGFTGRTLFTIAGDQPGDTFAHAFDASCDINNDGIPDLVVSAVGHTEGNNPNTGRVYMFLSFPLTLSPATFFRGETNNFIINGALPEEEVSFIYSRAGVGEGPLIPALGGLVLDLHKPIKYLGSAIANSSGEIVKPVFVPANLDLDRIFIQAVAVRGVNGSDSVKSNPVRIEIISR